MYVVHESKSIPTDTFVELFINLSPRIKGRDEITPGNCIILKEISTGGEMSNQEKSIILKLLVFSSLS